MSKDSRTKAAAKAGKKSRRPAARAKGPEGAEGAGSAGKAGNILLAPVDAHEWVSFEDPFEQRTWRFDVTFLLSHWECIFGHGCQGVLTEPAPELAQGCCSYGAHFTSPEDLARVKVAAKTLTPDQWQFADKGARGGTTRRNSDGVTVTRMVEDACIFLNRPDFPGGPGCALHRAALERGVAPMDLKPDVCWQLPLRREDTTNPDGSVTSVVGQWDRAHWGGGGDEFAWWCTEAPEAFGGATAVWRHMRPELCALVGADIVALLAPYLEARENAVALLPHPAVRRRP